MTLHEAIRALLSSAGRSMTTVEIAELINEERLYQKRDGSPVMPFQIHGRTRNYPELFLRDGNKVHLPEWPDPPTPSAVSKGAKAVPTPPAPASAAQEVTSATVNESWLDFSRFRPAGFVDVEIPDTPGLYAIRIIDRSMLPSPFGEIAEARHSSLLYIGIATRSLRRRFLHQELRARGHGTFFRSVGAILGYRPKEGGLIDKANHRNFKFSAEDNRAIIDWINNNLAVNWVEHFGPHAVEETALIQKYTPLLNLRGNPSALPELQALRADAVTIANTLT